MRIFRHILSVFFMMAVLFPLSGQEVPFGINYQAVARDSYGNELTSRQIDIKFTILSGTPLGTVAYQEVHNTISTSRYGVFTAIIGRGTPISGICETFSEISWDADPQWLRVEIKFDNDFLDMGTMPFLSVPYALYAAKSLEPGPEGPQGPPGDPASDTDDQQLSFDGENLSIDDGNTVNLAALLDVDDADPNPLNEIQDLDITDHILKITNNPAAHLIDLSSYLDNTDIQALGYNSITKKLYISNVQDSISLASLLNDPDSDPTNEIQDLSLSGDNLSISSSSSADIALGKYLDNTDEQDLSYDDEQHLLTISGGNSIGIGSIVAFKATISEALAIPNNTPVILIFDQILGTGYNEGSAYNTGSGIFSAPVRGIYTFHVAIDLLNATSVVIESSSGDMETVIGSTSSAGYYRGNCTMKLESGDEISVKVIQTNGFPIDPYNITGTFSGFKIY